MLNNIKKNHITQTVTNHLCENWKTYAAVLATVVLMGLGWKVDRTNLVNALDVANSNSTRAKGLNIASQSARGVGIFAKS